MKKQVIFKNVYIVFIVLNILKITIFNTFIVQPTSYISSMLYKFSITTAITVFVWLFILSLKHKYIPVIFYILQTAYIFANLAYYLYFHNYLHLFQSSVLLAEGLEVAGRLAVPKNPKLLILLLDLPAYIYMLYTYDRLFVSSNTFKAYRKVLASLCIIIVFCMEGWNYIHSYSLLHLSYDYSTNEKIVVERYGTLVNSIEDAWVNRNDQAMIKKLKYGKEIFSDKIIKPNPNFIVIQVESMDSNIVKHKYKGVPVMPYLNSLSQNCIYYPYALSYHKSGGTSDCEFSVLNSVEPLDNFPSMKINSYTYPNSIIHILSKNHYDTSAFHGNISSYFSRDKAYPKIGFKNFYDMSKMGFKDVGWGAPDKDVFAYAQKILEKQQSPFLYYIITMTSHGPFTNARNYYNNSHYNDMNDTVVKDYFNSMSYVDTSISNFIEYVKSTINNTYIIILGDHTPSINNNTFSQSSFYLDNKYFEFVPIFIITPDNKVYIEKKNIASFLDIGTTILYSSGLKFSFRSDGLNLLEPSKVEKVPFKDTLYDRNFLHNIQTKRSGV